MKRSEIEVGDRVGYRSKQGTKQVVVLARSWEPGRVIEVEIDGGGVRSFRKFDAAPSNPQNVLVAHVWPNGDVDSIAIAVRMSALIDHWSVVLADQEANRMEAQREFAEFEAQRDSVTARAGALSERLGIEVTPNPSYTEEVRVSLADLEKLLPPF